MAGALQLMLMRSAAPEPEPLMPYFVSKTAFYAGNAALSVLKPPTYADGDLFVLLVESANQTIATPSGFTQVANSPQSTGTAAAAGGVRLAVFYQIVSGGYQLSGVQVGDSGNHTAAQLFVFRGADISAPIDVTAGGIKSSATGTTFTLPSVTTSEDNGLVLLCVGMDRDAGSTTNLSGWANANLSNIVELADETTSVAAGGGLGLAIGGKTTAGSTGTTDVTSAAATTAAFITAALKASVDYFSVTRITGAYGSASDVAYGSGAAEASITLSSGGGITTTGNDPSANAAWVNNPAGGVGGNYWVRATGTASGTGSNSGATGSWIALSTDPTWSVSASGGTQSETWDLKFEFATSSSGFPVVGVSSFSLFAQSNTGVEP